MKPMNCPAHVQIFKQGIKSYRDLPIRMAEFGCCHRNEAHGALHGLMRVRQMTQDDAHIFCREDQIISDEAVAFCGLVTQVYEDLGFNEVIGQAGACGPTHAPVMTRCGTGPRARPARCADGEVGLDVGRTAGRGRVLRAED